MLFKRFISRLTKNEEGATAIEYGLLAALIALAIIGTVTTVGTNLSNRFDAVATALDNAEAEEEEE
ncbi:MAG: Flp family type IVb pilin [Pseudomonadota bacterium]